jgi:hypothetical protein
MQGDADSNTKDIQPPEAFSIPVPTTNQVQSYNDNNLGGVSKGEDISAETDPLAFKSAWSMFQIDMWLSWTLPKAITWLQDHHHKNKELGGSG